LGPKFGTPIWDPDLGLRIWVSDLGSTNFLTKKTAHGLIAKDGFMYAIGGYYHFDNYAMIQIDQYDVANDIWLQMTKFLPDISSRFCAVLVKGTDIWTIGGEMKMKNTVKLLDLHTKIRKK
jgi:hypothetical protein